MIKRFLALLTALMMFAGCACAQQLSSAPIATYTLPQGAEALHLWDSGLWEVPEGLEGLYYLMQNAEMYGNVYLVRMPHGRALVSVSCMVPENSRTAQELVDLWPQIAQNIAKEGVSVDASEHCASLENLYGFDALHIQTTIGLGQWGEDLQLNARGIAFPRGNELLEVWTVAPVEGTYAADDPAAQELTEDLAAMDVFMQSLSFTGMESMAIEGVPYTDPDGRFALVVPGGSTIITAHSTQEEIAQAREAYLAAHPEGADQLFDEYMNDVITQRVTLIIAKDQQVAVEIFASQEESFRDVTVDQLAALAQPIQQTLAEKFDAVLPLNAEQRSVISGSKHAWLTYWVRNGETDVQMDVVASVLDDAWLYEVDLYTHDGNQETRMLWYTFITQTLRYTPLTNALGD